MLCTVSPASATAALPTVTIRIAGPAGVLKTLSPVGSADVYRTYGQDVENKPFVTRTPAGCTSFISSGNNGVSILRLIADAGAVSTHVTSVDIDTGELNVLHPEAGDLDQPGSLPFVYDMPPMLSVDPSNGDLAFFVNCREPVSTVPGALNNGTAPTVTTGGNMIITVNLDGGLLSPTVTGPASTPARQPVSFAAAGAPPGSQWSWNFGDSPNPDPTQDGATGTHTYTTVSGAAGYAVQAAVTALDGSSGLSPVHNVVVSNASTAPTPTTPSPKPTNTPPSQQSDGNGPPGGSSQGPRDGNGPRSGGVPTNRGGTGAPGNTYDPRPSGVAATATANNGAVQANGEVVGYVLSDPTRAAAQAQQGAKKARDDSAQAARDGVESVKLSGWIIAVVAVLALLALGAGSERRRPTFTRARRKQ